MGTVDIINQLHRRMTTKPRGLLHLVSPSVQTQIDKKIQPRLKELSALYLETFKVIQELRKAVNLTLYGDELGFLDSSEKEPSAKR